MIFKVLGLALVLVLLGAAPADGAVRATITVTSPVDYRVYQRDGSNLSNIAISGRYTGNPKAIQARWRGGPWTTIDTTLTRTKGTFYGVLRGQRAGQGNLNVRFSNLTGLVDTVTYVGIGDIFVMAGQSNMGGRGLNNHQYTPTHVRASLLGNDYRWKELRDPYDSMVGQVDMVSADADKRLGSWVAQFANLYIRRTGLPVAFIPAARGGSKISEWNRSTSRRTLYGSMLNRVKVTGGKAKAMLWFQGENDSNTSADSYSDSLKRLADNAEDDFGAQTVPAIIGAAPYAGVHRAGVRMGTLDAIEENDNIHMGPSLYDVQIDDEGSDGIHFQSDRDLTIIGTRFWAAVNDAFFGGGRGYGPELEEARLEGQMIKMEFDEDIEESSMEAEQFFVMVGDLRWAINSVDIDDDTVRLYLTSKPLDGKMITVSYGHDNRTFIGHALYGDGDLPVVPFKDEEVDR